MNPSSIPSASRVAPQGIFAAQLQRWCEGTLSAKQERYFIDFMRRRHSGSAVEPAIARVGQVLAEGEELRSQRDDFASARRADEAALAVARVAVRQADPHQRTHVLLSLSVVAAGFVIGRKSLLAGAVLATVILWPLLQVEAVYLWRAVLSLFVRRSQANIERQLLRQAEKCQEARREVAALLLSGTGLKATR